MQHQISEREIKQNQWNKNKRNPDQ